MKTDAGLEAYLTPRAPGDEIDPEHRAWMDDQIRETLEKKKRGKMGYTPLDEVRRRFGF